MQGLVVLERDKSCGAREQTFNGERQEGGEAETERLCKDPLSEPRSAGDELGINCTVLRPDLRWAEDSFLICEGRIEITPCPRGLLQD